VGKHDTLPIISQLNAQAQAQAHAHANANAAGAIKDGEMCPQEVFFKVLIICFDPSQEKNCTRRNRRGSGALLSLFLQERAVLSLFDINPL